jgi:hypothetical protein
LAIGGGIFVGSHGMEKLYQSEYGAIGTKRGSFTSSLLIRW